MTVSNPQSFKNLLPLTTMASNVSTNTTGKLAATVFARFPVNTPANKAITNMNTNTIKACPTLSKVNTLFINASESAQEKEGQWGFN